MLLATLDRFIHEGGRLGSPIDKAKNYPGRIIASWNVNKDDLGYTNKRPGKHYKSILHYIAELERLAQASTGKDYISAATSSAIMPDLRLSGRSHVRRWRGRSPPGGLLCGRGSGGNR